MFTLPKTRVLDCHLEKTTSL